MKKTLLFLCFSAVAFMAAGCATRTIVYERPAPPAPQVEVITVKPYPKAIWVPGHWEWRRKRHGYVWVPGYWRR